MTENIRKWIFLMEMGRKYGGCHQLPTRSFFYKGYQFPICARCTGMLLGHILAIIVFIIYPCIKWYIAIALIVPCGIDGLVQYFTIYESSNFKRFITGIFCGFGMIYFMIQFIFFCVKNFIL